MTSDHSDQESKVSNVDSADPVRPQVVRGRGRGQSRSRRTVRARRNSSSDVPDCRDVAMEAVSGMVSEIRNQLSTLFDDISLKLNSLIVESKLANEHHSSAQSEPSIVATAKAFKSTHSVVGTLIDRRRPADDQKEAGSFIAPNTVPSERILTRERVSRVDDWIDRLKAETNTEISPLSMINSSAYSALQQLGPSVKVEPFDGDPRQWETFIGGFKALVHDVVHSNAQRVAIHSQLLSPRLRASLGSCLHSPEMYPEALANLRRLFGDPGRALDMYIHNLLTIAPMKGNSKEEIERFFFEVRGAVSTFRALGSEVELNSKATLHSVTTKLTYKLKTAWAKRAFDLSPKVATLADFDKWLEEMVVVQNSVLDAELDLSRGKRVTRSPKSTRRVNVLTSLPKSVICHICQQNHPLEKCPQFLPLSPHRRAETLKNFSLCFACFKSSHKARDCRSKKECGIDNCRMRHHPLIHGAPRVYARGSTQEVTQLPSEEPPCLESAMIGITATNSSDAVLLSVVPVTVISGNRAASTYALLDTGSEGSLITKRLAQQLQLPMYHCQLKLSTFHGKDPSEELFTTRFQICSAESDRTFLINNAIIVPSLNVSGRTVDWPMMKKNFDHLCDLPLVKVDYTQVEILLGADNFEAIQPLAVRQPPRKGLPYGVKTPLGWTVCGRFNLTKEERQLFSIHISRVSVIAAEGQASLVESLDRFWSTESFGTKANCELPVSAEEERAQRLLSSSTKFVGNRFSVGLLWKPNGGSLPNNRQLAVSRFLSLRRRLNSNPIMRMAYQDAMQDLFRRNVAREVPTTELELPCGRVWYLPHHAVRHPKKPIRYGSFLTPQPRLMAFR
uniref:Peptidase aspartic putative domain-containing protein n=1 Tax=Trichuris muris TaxID=70415 RepID=A0A5S6Q607_TRIMR